MAAATVGVEVASAVLLPEPDGWSVGGFVGKFVFFGILLAFPALAAGAIVRSFLAWVVVVGSTIAGSWYVVRMIDNTDDGQAGLNIVALPIPVSAAVAAGFLVQLAIDRGRSRRVNPT